VDDYRCEVRPEWVDYNGHLRDAYYGLIFSFAVDALMDHIGLDAAGRALHGSSLYTVHTQLRYLHELHAQQAVRVRTRVASHDAKRLRLEQSMWIEGRNEPVATAEQLLLHVATDGPRAAPFPEPVRARLQALEATAR
jgi:acyl-CoA thioester hydrolase